MEVSTQLTGVNIGTWSYRAREGIDQKWKDGGLGERKV